MARALASGAIERADLSVADGAMLRYAEKLTREPAAVSVDDTEELRRHGFDDAQLWEVAFTTSIFNLFPRMAEAFGIAPPAAWVTALGLDE